MQSKPDAGRGEDRASVGQAAQPNSLHLQIPRMDSEVPSPVAQQQMPCSHPSSEGSISELTMRVLVEIQVLTVTLAFNNTHIPTSVVTNIHTVIVTHKLFCPIHLFKGSEWKGC